MKPYEPDAARIRALYRIPTAPAPDRVLELCVGAAPVVAASPWPHASFTACDLTRPMAAHRTQEIGRASEVDHPAVLDYPSASFDRIVAHRTLDALHATDPRLRERGALVRFLRELASLLTPGGVLILGVQQWVPHRTAATRASGSSAGALSVHSARRSLESAGLSSVQVFSVIPSLDAPLRLISAERSLSRLGFRRELATMRTRLSLGGYLARRAAVELGVNRFLEPSLLMWGTR
jgi:SAM-dependent methyltransferase